MSTYKVKLECPHCGKDLTFDKKKNGVSIHQTKFHKIYRHMNDGPCAINNDSLKTAGERNEPRPNRSSN